MANLPVERVLRDRLERVAQAHDLLAAAAHGPAIRLYTAIAEAIAKPIPNAKGHFFLAQRGELLEFGTTDTGEMIERSAPSALDLGPWAVGRADGFAPFGYIRGAWCTVWLRADETLVGGAIITNLEEDPDESIRLAIQAIAAHAGAQLRMIAALEEAKRLSVTDPLTGAKTRQGFMDILQGACDARDNPYIIVFIDLDDFKQINDTQGHARGDEILIRTVETLKNTVRSDEIVARVGGDEFVVLVRADHADAKLISIRLSTALSDVGVKASVGAVPAVENAAASMRRADEAMYAAKATKKRNKQLQLV
jgi:diguanylate cyclase (GGDEF)-like protein